MYIPSKNCIQWVGLATPKIRLLSVKLASLLFVIFRFVGVNLSIPRSQSSKRQRKQSKQY